MEIEDKEKLNELYDCYKTLLTDKQREYYEMYFFNDYSLGEIAESLSVSRNAIFDQLKKVSKILEDYENKMRLVAINRKRDAMIDELEEKLKIDLTS